MNQLLRSRSWLGLLPALVTALCLGVFGIQRPVVITLPLEQSRFWADGFHAHEQNGDGRPYRWTAFIATLHLPVYTIAFQ